MGNNNEQAIADYWSAYLATLPEGHPHRKMDQPEAWGFGDGPTMADELGNLVVAGIKTATCSSVWELKAEGETVPQAGDLSIILNGRGLPMAIIETTRVDILPFNEVGADFASAEGEGDRSYNYWREGHWHYFGRTFEKLGLTLDEKMPVVCERFRMIFTR